MATQAKDKYYWSQLRGALTAGEWDSPTPAKDPSGKPLSWSELLRKFNKHVQGHPDVAEIASQTQALALLLAAASGNEGAEESDISIGQLPLGNECILPEERVQEAKVGFTTLRNIDSSNLNVSPRLNQNDPPLMSAFVEHITFQSLQFALAYYAYALGRPSDCLSYLSKVPDMSNIQSHVPGGSYQASSEPSSTTADPTAPPAEISSGRAWALTEVLRTICLEGNTFLFYSNRSANP